MPLKLETNKRGKANIHFNSCNGWVITFHCYEVLFVVYKTEFGLPLWRHVFDPSLEVVPGQKISFDCDGNFVE